jgi:hypothetical protein
MCVCRSSHDCGLNLLTEAFTPSIEASALFRFDRFTEAYADGAGKTLWKYILEEAKWPNPESNYEIGR